MSKREKILKGKGTWFILRCPKRYDWKDRLYPLVQNLIYHIVRQKLSTLTKDSVQRKEQSQDGKIKYSFLVQIVRMEKHLSIRASINALSLMNSYQQSDGRAGSGSGKRFGMRVLEIALFKTEGRYFFFISLNYFILIMSLQFSQFLQGLVWSWESLLQRHPSQIFIHHTWMWDQPVPHLQPPYQYGWMWFL